MAGAIKLLQYQILAYWRHAFSLRGKYDASSGFLLLILIAFAFRYGLLLKDAAGSLEAGDSEDVSLIFAIVFLAWMLPGLEGQGVSARIGKFLYLPLTKTSFSLINLASVFLVPTSFVSLIISLAAIYPLVFSKDIAGNLVTLFIFVLFSAFANVALITFIKTRLFRYFAFLSLIVLAFLFFSGSVDSLSGVRFSPAQTFKQNIVSENAADNIALIAPYLVGAFLLAFISIRQTILTTAHTGRILNPQLRSRIRFPLRFGELVKKDFIYSWKALDSWFAILAAIFYAVLLMAGDFSFESFSVAISIIAMLSGLLAFNIFGLENRSGIERLSLFPIRSEDLLRAKNKAFALVIFSQTFFLFPLVFLKFGTVLLIVSILTIVSIILLYTALGNSLSIKFPFQMRFYQLSFGGSLAAMLYGILAISLLITVPDFLTAGQTATKLIVNILLITSCWLIYKFSLRRTARSLADNWSNIAVKLS